MSKMVILGEQIIKSFERLFPNRDAIIPLHEPSFIGEEWDLVKDCLDTGWVSSVGKYVEEFEERIANFVGVKRAVAVVNGTAALHIALKIVGVQNGDEVLIPTLTFVATANAVVYSGAVPHFVDSDEKTLGINCIKLLEYLKENTFLNNGYCYNRNTGRKIAAIVPMHTFGQPVDMDPLLEICNLYNIKCVEDAAESLGSYYKGKHTGSLGEVGVLSFNGNKIITTGGGGAIVTNNNQLADYAKHLTTTAKVPHAWRFTHDDIGYNYRLPNINAALGCAQMEQLPLFIQNKRLLAKNYKEVFQNIEGISFYEEMEFSKSNYWLNILYLDENYRVERDALLDYLNHHGFMCRPVWDPLHSLDIFKGYPKMDLSVANQLSSSIINIPSSPNLIKRGASNV
ncbi:GDP-perosamine synthase [Paenibacillus sp. CECT 9249]|uniref:LegC family aminotransferase n=1 Tax=Paenibacillus sp. CECT 9249 TaxID=2845385 RepID=UPI001E2F423B|nr:LegC family aminotransferase [Paenibacillus sp. CECT 9249]CAH0118006.1 GDP-perosamine synthase [Paenibacillus sp. CECT 9249]